MLRQNSNREVNNPLNKFSVGLSDDGWQDVQKKFLWYPVAWHGMAVDLTLMNYQVAHEVQHLVVI